MNRLTARAIGTREFADDSWKVFCSARDVRFVESEYAVPRYSVEAVLTELRAWFARTDAPVPFPVEVRFIARDDVWLSTAYERDNAYVAVHQYHRMDPRPLFAAFEAIVAEHDGRPHWGKVHTLGAERLRALYPRFDDFRAVRERLDPGPPVHQRPRRAPAGRGEPVSVTEREITTPVELCRPDGRLNPAAVGWTRHPLHDTSRIGTGRYGWGRNKRWEYWARHHPDPPGRGDRVVARLRRGARGVGARPAHR